MFTMSSADATTARARLVCRICAQGLGLAPETQSPTPTYVPRYRKHGSREIIIHALHAADHPTSASQHRHPRGRRFKWALVELCHEAEPIHPNDHTRRPSNRPDEGGRAIAAGRIPSGQFSANSITSGARSGS
jgi:hypothetical protein